MRATGPLCTTLQTDDRRQTTDDRRTDRQTDRRHAYDNSRSYCVAVAVRSAKNCDSNENAVSLIHVVNLSYHRPRIQDTHMCSSLWYYVSMFVTSFYDVVSAVINEYDEFNRTVRSECWRIVASWWELRLHVVAASPTLNLVNSICKLHSRVGNFELFRAFLQNQMKCKA